MLQQVLQFAIGHRFVVLMLTLLAAGLGLWSLQRLPIDAVPDITNNQVQINTLIPALSPDEVEKQITFPIETALAGIPGLQYTRSLSRNGFSQVQAVFEDHVDIYFARQQVNERLAAAKEALPPGAEPAMGPISTGLGEVVMWTVEYEHPRGAGAPAADGTPGWQTDGTYLTARGQTLATDVELAAHLRTVQDWIIRPQLKGVKDVAGVDAIGGYVKQYHVTPDPVTLASYGLTFHDVIDALERNNLSAGAGFIEHKGEAYTVRAAGRIETEGQIAQIVVGTRNGVPIHVSDIGRVGVGAELRTGSASENGEEVVVGTALMLIGANSRTVAADVTARIRQIAAQSMPPGVIIKPVLDRTRLVDATVETVRHNLTMGAILVIVVLFLLLGNLPAAVLTALAIPLAMLLTATGMVHAKISGNLLSLGAVDFGLIVDGAVIVVENCLRRLAEKQHAVGRALTTPERLAQVSAAAREMVKPSVFGQAIIITVYLPILALTGVEGKMFRPMALTVIFALVAAFVLSLTFIPAMVAVLIRGRVSEKENLLIRGAKSLYAPALRRAVRGRWAVVPAAVLVFGASLWLFTRLGQEFTPTLDEHDIALQALRIPSTGLSQSTRMQAQLEKTLSTFPEVAFVFSKTGTAEVAADPMPPSVSDTFIILKDASRWRSEADLDRLIEQRGQELAGVLHGDAHAGEADHDEPDARAGGHKGKLLKLMELEARALPGNNYEWTQPIQMRFNELIAGVRGDLAVKVYGDDFGQMQAAADQIARVLQSVPGAADVKTEQTEGLPVMTIVPDRPALARFGLNVADVQEVVTVAIGGRKAGQVFEGDQRFDLVVRLPEDLRSNLTALEDLPVPLPAGRAPGEVAVAARPGDAAPPADLGFVPLASVARVDIAEGANQISRENGKRRVVVQANIRGRDMGSFVAEAQRRIAAEVHLPPGTWLDWGGQFENLRSARERLAVVVPLCFFLIFLLLFSAFNNVKYALIVFSGVPLALTGGIVALWLRDMPFSISAAVGFIALSGVAVLNGLVMVTFINQLRADGLPLDAAVTHGSLTRLRPVLMTALVAALGFVPMAFATGTGAEVQKPLATVVIGGIVSSTLLTLVVLPALYRLWHKPEHDPGPAAHPQPPTSDSP
jgi:cobalt-zinc-cadmium resistance protein CzcA